MEKTVLHIVSGDLFAGKETQLALQLPAVRAAGWDAQALLFNFGEAHDRFANAGVPVTVVPEHRGAVRLFRSLLRAVTPLAPALLVAHGYKEAMAASYLSFRLGVPWISVFHGALEQQGSLRQTLKGRLYWSAFLHLTKARASAWVTVSRELGERLGLLGAPRHLVWSNTCAANDGHRAGELSENEARPLIVTVGRLVAVKRFDRAVRSFSQLLSMAERARTAQLFIIGEGPLKEELEALAASVPFGERVRFLGYRSDAAAIIRRADVLLLSSDSEGMPTVLLEAAAAAVPVVSTKVGGVPELFELLPGYPVRLVELREGDSGLAEALGELLEDGSTADRAQLQRMFEQRFSPAQAAARQIETYQMVLTERRVPQ